MVRRKIASVMISLICWSFRVTITDMVVVTAAALVAGMVEDTAVMVVGIGGDTTIEWVI